MDSGIRVECAASETTGELVMAKEKLPAAYQEAEEWARLFLKRLAVLKKRYEEDEYFRRYFSVTGGSENADVKRTSMDLSKSLVKIRKGR